MTQRRWLRPLRRWGRGAWVHERVPGTCSKLAPCRVFLLPSGGLLPLSRCHAVRLQASAAALTRGATTAAVLAMRAALTSPSTPFAAEYAHVLALTGMSGARCDALRAARVGTMPGMCMQVGCCVPILNGTLPAAGHTTR